MWKNGKLEDQNTKLHKGKGYYKIPDSFWDLGIRPKV